MVKPKIPQKGVFRGDEFRELLYINSGVISGLLTYLFIFAVIRWMKSAMFQPALNIAVLNKFCSCIRISGGWAMATFKLSQESH